jgi:hypothetical protein
MGEGVAARLLVGGLTLGFVGQLLFVGQRPGINVVLWVASLLAAAVLVRPAGARVDRADLWLPAAVLAFAAMVALRADPALSAFDTVAAVGLTGAGLVALSGVPVTRRSSFGIGTLALAAVATTLAGIVRLSPALAIWQARRRSVGTTTTWRVARGLLMALPALLVFAALFASADAVFARVVGDLFTISLDTTDLTVRTIVLGFAAWLSAGLLVAVAEPEQSAARATAPANTAASGGPVAETRRFTLGTLEATVVLLAVDLLFAAFVALQAAYLFGGLDTLSASGLTYSAYARRGFFELIGVAVGAGALIIVLEVLVAVRTRPYVFAALALTALTAVVLGSALVRLGLYQSAYGWTELRFHALAAIVWLAIALAAAAVTLALGRSRWLVHAVVVSGLAVALAVNVIDPRAFVARQNIERALRPELVPADGRRGLDTGYLIDLGDDAVPVLLEALPALPLAEREELRDALRRRLEAHTPGGADDGWPSFNLARERARQLLEDVADTLGAP